ncbi:MAG TPA: response regulator [Candidatus Angelobacter sp.]
MPSARKGVIYTSNYAKTLMPISREDVTILIVDDDPLHLKLYSWILQRKSYKCATALVQSSSVDLPENASVNLVLLDYRLKSSLTTLEVVSQIRDKFAAVPIVILSDLQWMPDEMRGEAVAFVNKGDPKLLLQTISDVLQDEQPKAETQESGK